MNPLKPVLTALVFIAIPAVAQSSGQIPAASDHARSFPAREAAAKARILTGRSSADGPAWQDYRAIERDPAAAAAEAADRGDFRFIWFDVNSLTPPLSYEPLFAGVDCSVVWPTGMTRAVWINFYSDLIGLGPPKPAPSRFKEAVARAYNLALLQHPAFPYADLCIASDGPDGQARAAQGRAAADALRSRPQTQAFRVVPQRWWSRWSDRRVPASATGNALALAVRNGDPLPSFDPAQVDETDEFGMTALGWAAARSSSQIVAQLLASGADPWFGDQCSRRTRSLAPYGLWGEDMMTTPLAIAIVHGRQNIAMQMLRASPHKECARTPDNLPPLAGAGLALRMVGAYAAVFGAEEVHRLLISDFLDRVAAQDTSERRSAYNDMIEYAWQKGFGELMRTRPSEELLGARSFVRQMARNSTRDELLYWIDRLDLRQPSSVAEMIGSVSFNRWAGPAMKEDFAGKFEILASIGAGLSASDKQAIVRDVFEDGVASTDGEPKNAAVEILGRYGYDLSGVIFTGAFPRMAPNACTPLMVALSYSYADECRPDEADPDLASALLEAGVNPNVGRTSSGLSALDLVERRAASGPWPDAFAKVRAKMIALGAVAGSKAPPPVRR